MEPFTFATSRSLENPNVSIRIDTLEGTRTPLPFTTLLSSPELKHVGSNTSPSSDLYVTVTVWADSKPLTVPIQTSYKSFKTTRTWMEWLTLPVRYCDLPLSAQLAITIWDISGPLNTVPFGGTTVRLFERDNTLKKGRQKCKVWLGVEADGLSDSTTPSPCESGDEMDRLEKLVKKHELGEMPRSDHWLDNLVFREIERVNRQHSEKRKDEHFLFIDFPRWDFPIVYAELEYKAPGDKQLVPADAAVNGAPGARPANVVMNESTQEGKRVCFKVFDPEVVRDNPAESKHRRLVRSQRNGIVDRDLKPNAKIRDELNEILNYGPTHDLTSDEKDLIWKFRFYLTRDKRALTKFVKSVAWTDTAESKSAVQLIPKWTEIDVTDALELLGPNINNASVRAYAVDRLRAADDEELQLYLLQLVQALKFEAIRPDAEEDAVKESSLARFLIMRACDNPTLGSYFHWYLVVETDDPDAGRKKLYSKIAWEFQVALKKTSHGDETRGVMKRQSDFVFMIGEAAKEIQSMRDRTKKEDKLKQILRDPKSSLLDFEPIPLPLDPTVNVVGCVPEKAMVFKSSLFPILIHLKTDKGDLYPIIFKSGDDLRQDQLVIQIITLMDKLLRKENLDLKLMPYRILATSAFTGIVQFVQSMTLANIEEGKKTPAGVLPYLRSTFPDETQELGVKAEVMDTYVKSCAGYCVVTYLLGVGDRHLDNLLLTPDGHFFHADFGYILGRDPKWFAPMKLCKEMVDGMGGTNSANYQKFRSYCYTAYTTLRKSANLILNLFALMVDANIPDIRLEPDKAVLKVKERFMLELSEEQAIQHFRALIDDSMNSVLPVLIDRVHVIAQRWRK
ncbi:kinase-like domain-containing protein [Pyronema domesticum]|uniref:Phosphatidylinositol 3-kinase VPS34 n=1 Tax=Pyronema omphalodes (strain CBS 100304) TaxID=1076935 RepID=U4LAX7_PYROM|nr:kinase-like domain-containing protein [Pyronema domesticum]CCX16633.1 Similar to Phosphatidylinositol 3-kinase vps34; acc. no. P50520 [Pyronema omphalodes CBS 100304]